MLSKLSTERVAKHRAKVRATKDGTEEIKKRNRASNKKYQLKVKKLKLEIAANEKFLGIETRHTPRSRAKQRLPSEKELRHMSMADLSEWKRRQSIDHKRQLSREKKKKESIKSLETKLSTLQDMWFLVKVADAENLPGDSTTSARSYSNSNLKEDLDTTWVQGMLDDEGGDRVRTDSFVTEHPELNTSEDLDPVEMQEIALDQDAYMVWLHTFAPAFRDSNFLEEIDFTGKQEIAGVLLS